MAAESPEDKAVDDLIDQLQSTLDKLKAAQRKDVDDESGEYEQPKNLKEAGNRAYRLLSGRRKSAE